MKVLNIYIKYKITLAHLNPEGSSSPYPRHAMTCIYLSFPYPRVNKHLRNQVNCLKNSKRYKPLTLQLMVITFGYNPL